VNAKGRELDNVERLFAEPDAPRVRSALDGFFEEVRALRREVERDGASLAVIVFPFRFQVEPGAPPAVVQDRIAAFCAAERLSCLDLLPVLSRVGPAAFVDYDHLSASGAALVADTLYASRLLVEGDARDVLREALGDRAEDEAAVRAALRDPSAAVRKAAADALGAMGARARASGESLFAALDDGREAVRHAAAQALARIGTAADDRARLVGSLPNSDPYVAAFAAWSLGNLGAEAQDAVPELVRALGRDETNAVVAGALARIGPAASSAVPELAKALESEDADRRWRAARTLGRIGPAASSAVPALTRALGDPHATVRQHAARALGRIGAEARSAAATLQRATGDPDEQVRREARQALERLH
jgi:hypothetical protein